MQILRPGTHSEFLTSCPEDPREGSAPSIRVPLPSLLPKRARNGRPAPVAVASPRRLGMPACHRAGIACCSVRPMQWARERSPNSGILGAEFSRPAEP